MSGDPDRMLGLARKLRAGSTFEAGSAALIDAIADVLGAAFGADSLARGVVHLRSDETGYRALVVRELGAGGHSAIAPSATVFRVIDRVGGGVAVDLATCRGIALADRSPVEVMPAYAAHDASSSIGQMIDRETSHIVALPLRARDLLIGMIGIELAWPKRVGLPWPDGRWGSEVDALAEIAAPLLLALPTAEIEPDPNPILPVIGEATRGLLRVLSVFASQDETLLLSGPTGAGKSRLAQICHERSPRRAGPFQTANLLAVPEMLQMGELFGWRRGAFTGALTDHEGLIASAEGGTLFLDEIDKLSAAAQAGLLRVLETRRYAPLGGTKEREANVRFIVATNTALAERVRVGEFREDLYYRINVLPVRIPGLGERRDEIRGWARLLLARRRAEGTGRTFHDAALALLEQSEWPGSLRQLDNVVRRAYALSLADPGGSSTIGAATVRAALAFDGATRRADSGPREAIERIATAIVERALAERRAGRTLGLETVEVLSAAVLRVARERVGSLKDAYLLFGGETMVANRNQTKHFRRASQALDALLERLDAEG